MKKIILSLTLAAGILTSSFANAAYKDPGSVVKDAFTKEFANIKDVKWSEKSREGVFEAIFIYNNENVKAYFSEDGEFLGTARLISKAQLPILVAKQLESQYSDAKIINVCEHSMSDGLAYYITVQTQKAALILHATGNGDLTVYKRIKH